MSTEARVRTKKSKKNPRFRPDLLWKDLLEHFLYAALEVFHPELYCEIDLCKKPVFLNKELRIPGKTKGMKIVDLLADVPLKTGKSASVLLHTELQGANKDEPFNVRMYKYGCLITLRLGRPFTALAIRTTPKEAHEEVFYETECFGTRTTFSYVTVFIDQLDEKRLLAMEENPVALAAVAAARMLKAGRSEVKRFEYARELLRMMKARGYPQEDREQLVFFIEGITNLSMERLIKELERDMSEAFGEGQSMYMTPIAKRVLRKKAMESVRFEGRTEGRVEGIAEGKLEGRVEGRVEGRTEGRAEGKREIARSMLADAMTPDLISKFTGLSVEEIEALRE